MNKKTLIDDFEAKIERFEDLPMEVLQSHITGQDLLAVMKDILAIFKEMT